MRTTALGGNPLAPERSWPESRPWPLPQPLALFALTLSAAANLEFVYPPELFPTHLRATGVGLATAGSRFGSALSTFLLPIVVQSHGVSTALGACVVVMIIGGIACQAWAPETGRVTLDSIGEDVEALRANA